MAPAPVAIFRQRDEGWQRRPLAHLRIVLAVDELQKLNRELDVAKAARAELQLVFDLIVGDVVRDALAHPLNSTRTRRL